VGELDEILLQWIDTERVADLEIVILAVGPLGVHHIALAAPRERRGDSRAGEASGVKASQYRGGEGHLHRGGMLGRLPRRVFRAVTRSARRGPDELRTTRTVSRSPRKNECSECPSGQHDSD